MFGTANIGDAVKTVREDVFIQTLENNSVIPSKECLELRALNLSFQLKIWNQATKPIMTVPDPTTHGWKDVDGTLEMIPDSKENQEKQASVYETVMKNVNARNLSAKMGSVGVSTASRIVPLFVNVKIVVIHILLSQRKKMMRIS